MFALVAVLAFLWWPTRDPNRKLVRKADKLFNEQLVGKVELTGGPWEVNADTTEYKYHFEAGLLRPAGQNADTIAHERPYTTVTRQARIKNIEDRYVEGLFGFMFDRAGAVIGTVLSHNDPGPVPMPEIYEGGVPKRDPNWKDKLTERERKELDKKGFITYKAPPDFETTGLTEEQKKILYIEADRMMREDGKVNLKELRKRVGAPFGVSQASKPTS